MEDWKQIVGSNVRRLRQDKGLTQEQLAFEAELDLTYVGGIERGRRNPSLLVMAAAPCGRSGHWHGALSSSPDPRPCEASCPQHSGPAPGPRATSGPPHPQ